MAELYDGADAIPPPPCGRAIAYGLGAALHLSPTSRMFPTCPFRLVQFGNTRIERGRGRPAGPGEGASPSPESPDPPHPLGFADRPLPCPSRMFPTWTTRGGEVGNTRLRGERWAEALYAKCDSPAPCGEGLGVGAAPEEAQRATALHTRVRRPVLNHPHPYPPHKGEGHGLRRKTREIPPLSKGRVALGDSQGSGGDRSGLRSILTDPHPALPFARGGISARPIPGAAHG